MAKWTYSQKRRAASGKSRTETGSEPVTTAQRVGMAWKDEEGSMGVRLVLLQQSSPAAGPHPPNSAPRL